jgi:hypothetical protein
MTPRILLFLMLINSVTVGNLFSQKILKSHKFDKYEVEFYESFKLLTIDHNDNIKKIVVSNSNKLWFLSDKGISSFNGVEWENFTSKEIGFVGDVNNLISISLDTKNNLWLSVNNNGIYKYDGNIWAKVYNNIGYLHVDKHDQLFVVTYDSVKKTLPVIKISGNNIVSVVDLKLSEEEIIPQFINDNAGNVWFYTINDGVYRYETNKLTHFSTQNNSLKQDTIITGMIDNKGDLYFQYVENMYSSNNDSLKFGVYRYDGENWHDIKLNKMWFVNIDSKNRFWGPTDENVVSEIIFQNTCKINYSRENIKYGDILQLTVSFSDVISTSQIPKINMIGANNLTGAILSKVNDSLYTFQHVVQQGDGEVKVIISANDYNDNPIDSIPTIGGTFNIKGTLATNSLTENFNRKIEIFPNPTSTMLTIKNAEEKIISLFGINGVEVYRYFNTKNIHEIVLNEITNKGIYFLQISNKNGSNQQINKIIIE